MQVQHVELLVAERPHRAQRARRVRRQRRHRSVGGGRQAVAERRHERGRRWPIARGQDADLDAHLAELARPIPSPAPAPHRVPTGCTGRPSQPAATAPIASRPRFPRLQTWPRSRTLPDFVRSWTMTAARQMPALSVTGTPTKRNAILELAAEAERRGFAGLASPGVARQPGPVQIARPRHQHDPLLDEHPTDLPRPRGRSR